MDRDENKSRVKDEDVAALAVAGFHICEVLGPRVWTCLKRAWHLIWIALTLYAGGVHRQDLADLLASILTSRAR